MKKLQPQALILVALSLLLCVCTKDKVNMFGSISGVVQDSNNNKIEGATVALEPGGLSKLTGKDGAYSFDDLEAKEYTLTYSKDGYITQTKESSVKPDVNAIVNITLALEPLVPKLFVNPLSLDFGKEETTRSMEISNTGNSVLNWKIEHEPSWFICSPKAGTTEKEKKTSVVVTVNRNQMKKDSYKETFSIASDGGRQDITVTMTVGGVNLRYTPSELDFKQIESKISLSLYNMEGDGTIDYEVKVSNAWIVPERTSGKLTGHESLGVNVNRESLSPGEYTGSLVLKVGNEEFSIPVKMIVAQGKAIVSINPVTAVTSDGARLSGLISNVGASKVTEHGFCVSASPGPTVNDVTTKLGDCSQPKSFESEVQGLKPNTVYYVRAYAENQAGVSYSKELQFTTLAPSPSPPTVETGDASDVTASTAKVGGNISRLGYPDVTQHGHVWGTSRNPEVVDYYSTKTTLGPKSNVGSFESSLSNLSKGTTYYVRAYATNGQGTVYGREIVFETLTPVPPTVETGAASDITLSVAKVGGNITSLGYPGTDITQHGHVWSTSSNPTVDSSAKTTLGARSNTGTFQSSLSNLSMGTTYYVRAYATNGQGTAYGSESSFTTLSPAQPTVETGVASDITSLTAKMGGNITSLGDWGTVTQHGHVWSTSSNPTVSLSTKTTLGAKATTGSFQSSLNNLSKGTTYYVKAYATNTQGTVYGQEIVFTTSDVEEGTLGTLTWRLENGILTIRGNGAIPHSSSNSWWYNKNITKVIIQDGVLGIGNYAFQNCRGLTSVVIPGSVIDIGNRSFDGCSKLTSVTIPGSVTNIGEGAFAGAGLVSVIINNSGASTNIGDYAFFHCTGLASITLPNSVKSIGNYAFSGCTGLASVTLPNSVKGIGSSVFSGCIGLTSITIPNSVTNIGSSAFSGCSGLTSIIIPNSVTSISDNTFSGCTVLQDVTIPNSVTSIGKRAFRDCRNLRNVIVQRATPPQVYYDSYYSGENTFDNATLISATLTVPLGNKGAYASKYPWVYFGTIIEQ